MCWFIGLLVDLFVGALVCRSVGVCVFVCEGVYCQLLRFRVCMSDRLFVLVCVFECLLRIVYDHVHVLSFVRSFVCELVCLRCSFVFVFVSFLACVCVSLFMCFRVCCFIC